MKQQPSPNITFGVSGNEIPESPKLSAIALQQMIRQLGLEEIATELEIEKHHGISVHDIIFVLLLYSSYDVTSIAGLASKAKKDQSLASVLEDVKKINNKVILYFQQNNEISTYEQLVDRIVSSGQTNGRIKSTKKGILIVDDSPLIKTGKKMEEIEIIFDHVEKRYVLGYVLVSTSYADKTKSYCVNFEFRLSTEEDRNKAQEKKLKKKEKIDLRKKGSLINWIKIQINSGIEVEFVQVSGVNLDAETLDELDARGIDWVALPSGKTAILDQEMNKRDFDSLKQAVTRTQPAILEIEGWEVYTKPVLFKDYGEMVFCVVKDFQGNELGCFLLKKEAMHTMISILQEFFTREQPADNNKLKIGLDLFERAKSADVQAETACGDAWFLVAWFVAKVLEIEGIKRFISKMKSNTKVVYKGQVIKVKDLWDSINLELVSGRSIKAGAVLVTVKGFENPLKIVFVQELDKYGRAKARYILVCTDVHFSKEKIIETYKLRWTIECFFRTAKQRFGLDKFHVRKFNEIHSHITFVFISYLLMACLKISNPKLADLSFGQIIDRYLKSLVTLQRTAEGVLVYLDPGFFKEFGFPYDTS